MYICLVAFEGLSTYASYAFRQIYVGLIGLAVTHGIYMAKEMFTNKSTRNRDLPPEH